MGDEKDVYSYKQALKTSKKAQKETINTARQLLPKVDKKMLEWQKSLENKSSKQIEDKSKKAFKEPEYEFKEQIPKAIPLLKKDEEYPWLVNTGL